MMKTSAGLLMYRFKNGKLKVYLVHPGGPFFKNKDERYWSVPKGLVEEGEDLLAAAKREFEEETGIKPCGNNFIPLDSVVQSNRKIVHAWAFEHNENCPDVPKSNLCEITWPPCSGIKQQIPEIDKGEFFNLGGAKKKIKKAQAAFIERLVSHLSQPKRGNPDII